MTQIDEHHLLSEQDYGPWLDRATLHQTDDGQLLLEVEGGYSKPYYVAWYSLSDLPNKPLSEAFDGDNGLWADPTSDQSEDFADLLGVQVHKVERPAQ